MSRNFDYIRLLLHLVAALPLLYAATLIARSAAGDLSALGADPSEELMSYLGEWGLRGIIVTLAISPIQRLAPKLRLIRYRRLFGLWAFAFLCLHAALYIIVISGLNVLTLLEDILERPFIILGVLGFLLLLPLAITSTAYWKGRLGPYWRRLHRLIYLAALVGLGHFFLQVRSDYGEFVLTALVAGALLLSRFYLLKGQKW